MPLMHSTYVCEVPDKHSSEWPEKCTHLHKYFQPQLLDQRAP